MHVLHTECVDHALANGNGFALAFCCGRATTHCLSRERAMSTSRLPHVFRTGVLLAALVALPAVSFADNPGRIRRDSRDTASKMGCNRARARHQTPTVTLRVRNEGWKLDTIAQQRQLSRNDAANRQATPRTAEAKEFGDSASSSKRR